MDPHAPTLSAAPRARLLIVDDEPNIRDTFAAALQMLGYAAETACSGSAALAALQHGAFDLMLLDLKMPAMDGIEVMRQASARYPRLLIIILTGHATLASAISAVQSGAVDYLLKPLGIAEIAQAIARALEQRAATTRRDQLIRQALDALHAAEQTSALSADASAPVAPPTCAERVRQVGTLTLDCQKRLCVVHAFPPRTLYLTEGETAILAALMARPRVVQTCRELARAAWQYELDELQAISLVRPYIFRLRQKLETTNQQPPYIQTMRGHGYTLIAHETDPQGF